MSLAAMTIPPVVLPLVRKSPLLIRSVLPSVVERNLYLQKRRTVIVLFLERKVVAVIILNEPSMEQTARIYFNLYRLGMCRRQL